VTVSVRDARGSREDRDWIRGVYRAYLDDLAAGSTGLFPALSEFGHQESDLLASWFRDEKSVPFVILRGGEQAGFALVTRMAPPAPRESPGFRLTEFFVAAQHRNRGVGRDAATLLFSRFAGEWLVTEQSRNASAVRFWRRVISGFTSGRYTERMAGAEVRHTFTSHGARRTVS
jgi:predicted acetyltransferase